MILQGRLGQRRSVALAAGRGILRADKVADHFGKDRGDLRRCACRIGLLGGCGLLLADGLLALGMSGRLSVGLNGGPFGVCIGAALARIVVGLLSLDRLGRVNLIVRMTRPASPVCRRRGKGDNRLRTGWRYCCHKFAFLSVSLPRDLQGSCQCRYVCSCTEANRLVARR